MIGDRPASDGCARCAPRRILGGMVLCPAFGTLAVRTWLSLPMLFVSGSAGLAALLELVMRGRPEVDVNLSVPLLCGFGAAVALLSGGQVQWLSGWQRLWLRYGYPLLLLGCALSLDGLRLPAVPALCAGTAAVTALAVLVLRDDPCGS